MKSFDPTKNLLVPEHSKLTKSETNQLLEEYNIDISELPKILATDPAIQKLNVKIGDIIKVVRDSPTAGKSIYYRVVING